MKNLPVGKQNFEEIITNDLLYIDKTDRIYKIIKSGNLYFFSRPRRFGKSLLISLFAHLFQGKKELFKDLYIGKSTNYDFQAYPVLQFNFADFGHRVENLEEELSNRIQFYAKEYDVEISNISLSTQFVTLIQGIAQKNKPVVLLIDEYDKPIIDFFTEPEKAKINKNILRDFFSPLKGLDTQGLLHFLFIAGISKFSKVSLFSDLNNLTDLSISIHATDLVGITQTELENNFQPYIESVANKFELPQTEVMATIKEWYNGYSFDGNSQLYNPFSLLSFFYHQEFENFWFETGTPTFLVESIRDKGINPKDFERIRVDNLFFTKFSLEDLDIVGLLFQTGYLTIKKLERQKFRKTYILSYPNEEVRYSMTYHLLSALTYSNNSTTNIRLEFD